MKQAHACFPLSVWHGQQASVCSVLSSSGLTCHLEVQKASSSICAVLASSAVISTRDSPTHCDTAGARLSMSVCGFHI